MEYKYIRAWGRMMGSYESYIKIQIAKAKADNAPADAIFKDHDGIWHTFAGIQNEDTKRVMSEIVSSLK